ncbi:hypothetical protein JD844_028530 [Phrynosoma platyrhinos]|uniref:PCNA-interacting partner n=1 Tax=Phrynosoma platyrhinos TaxID=52577 RepID=A0ABQ7SI38_PHRPL|nr:hypothetical protein JD844_028530 [Phrynosoma platyrhinos]
MLDLIDIYKKWRVLSLENDSISSEVVSTSDLQYRQGKRLKTSREQLLEFIVGKVDLSNENNSNRMNQDNEEKQVTQLCFMQLPLKVKKIMYSYVSLLVNSKNDLAFACVLNIPERGLGRRAFTDLKHAAQKKQMSIFLMATSFIRTIELGGKGYAPSSDDPLRIHVKGLSQIIHFMDKLEEIIGEIPDPGLAGGRILSTIKIYLTKGRNSKDPFCQAAEEVLQDLDLQIKNIKNFQHEPMAASTTGISPARPKVHAINHGTAYCGRDTVKSLLALLDEAATHQPPNNKAQLLFDEEFGFPSTIMLYRRVVTDGNCQSPVQSTGCSPKPLRQRIRTAVCEKELKLKQPLIRSQFACTYKDDQMTESKSNHFSTRQVPEFIHPVPKRLAALFLQDELTVDSLHSNLKSAALGKCSGNLQQNGSKSKEIGKVSGKPKNKSAKRKQVDRTSENVICTNDNESLQHLHSKRPKTATNCQNSLDSNIKRERKCNRTLAKNKLIAGQSKLTQFFRF